MDCVGFNSAGEIKSLTIEGTENTEENHRGITGTSTCIIYLYAKSL